MGSDNGTQQWDPAVGPGNGTRRCDLAVCVVAILCGLNIQCISNLWQQVTCIKAYLTLLYFEGSECRWSRRSSAGSVWAPPDFSSMRCMQRQGSKRSKHLITSHAAWRGRTRLCLPLRPSDLGTSCQTRFLVSIASPTKTTKIQAYPRHQLLCVTFRGHLTSKPEQVINFGYHLSKNDISSIAFVLIKIVLLKLSLQS